MTDNGVEFLDIPAFLNRGRIQSAPRKRVKVPSGRAWSRMVPNHTPPDGYEPVRLRLGDEIPHAGCGVRVVHIKAGWKWVYVWSSSTGTRRRLKRTAWDLLRKTSEMPV